MWLKNQSLRGPEWKAISVRADRGDPDLGDFGGLESPLSEPENKIDI